MRISFSFGFIPETTRAVIHLPGMSLHDALFETQSGTAEEPWLGHELGPVIRCLFKAWIPAFAGMTTETTVQLLSKCHSSLVPVLCGFSLLRRSENLKGNDSMYEFVGLRFANPTYIAAFFSGIGRLADTCSRPGFRPSPE
jgi:hypothetical protein